MTPTASAPPLLEMEGISKRFGGVVALDRVHLSVGRSEIVALIGENGAGKSTLMKVLGGVHAPDEGAVRVDGKPARIRSVSDANRLGIGFIHQELNLLDNLDVAANVFLGREPTRGGPLRLIDRATMERETETCLRQLGVSVSPRTPVALLSLAQRQMVEIARALSLQARLLIMDEPTSSLTLTETQRLLSVVQELRAARGVGIIYISHRLREIEVIADRVVALRDGKNAGDLARDQISHDAMVRLMVGRDLTPPAPSLRLGSGVDTPLLSVRALRTRRYPGHAVSFDLHKGEILGFAGLIGAGRSEVAQALFGIEPAVSGEVLLDGAPLRIASPRDAIRRGIYLIPEDRRRAGLILSMAIRENVTLPSLSDFAAPLGLIQRGRERQAAQERATKMNVRSAAATVEAPAATLSGGNQQKVVLAKWVSLRPTALIFDEPTRGVDVGAKAEIYALIRALAGEGVAVLMISSDMEEVIALSDRIAVMHEGKVAGILPRADYSEEAILRLAVGQGSGPGDQPRPRGAGEHAL